MTNKGGDALEVARPEDEGHERVASPSTANLSELNGDLLTGIMERRRRVYLK